MDIVGKNCGAKIKESRKAAFSVQHAQQMQMNVLHPKDPGCLLPQPPSHPAIRSFSFFMSQREAWIKMKGYIRQNLRPRSKREEKIPAARALLLFKAPAIVWASIQAYCCSEISRAPFRSRGMPHTPLLFRVQICACIDTWPRLPSPLTVALCPLS